MISVIIVTYNRTLLLKRCLDSLLKQDFNKEYEIIVIDNCSSDCSENFIRRQVNGKVKRFRNQERLDLATCKNMGLIHASGDTIAFIDDDCFASKDWLNNIENSLENYDFVGGPVLPTPETKFPPWWNSSLDWLVGINVNPNNKFLPLGSNIAFKKHVLDALQKNIKYTAFDNAYYLPYAEDNYRVKEALKLKFSLKINQNMIVFHNISQQRLKIAYLLKRSFREGLAGAMWQRDAGDLLYSLIGLVVNPTRMLIYLDFGRFFRLISNISYILSYIKQSALFPSRLTGR